MIWFVMSKSVLPKSGPPPKKNHFWQPKLVLSDLRFKFSEFRFLDGRTSYGSQFKSKQTNSGPGPYFAWQVLTQSMLLFILPPPSLTSTFIVYTSALHNFLIIWHSSSQINFTCELNQCISNLACNFLVLFFWYSAVLHGTQVAWDCQSAKSAPSNLAGP